MISIITPFYNSQRYLNETIVSVMNQNYDKWELLLVNDGSTDNSKLIAQSFNDSRIHYFEQPNKGVSAARNLGLLKGRGEYFCFLDADDVLPPNSLHVRFKKFEKNPFLDFVDGYVQLMDAELNEQISLWKPDYHGNPLQDLLRQEGKSFFNPSWMIRRKTGKLYRFHENLTHGEDLLFLLELSREGALYDYVDEPILKYRDTPGSAMKNLDGLENGYRYIEKQVMSWNELDKRDLYMYKYKWRKAMFLSYLRSLQIRKSFNSLV